MTVRPRCHCGTTMFRGRCQNQRCDQYEPVGMFRLVVQADGERHVLHTRLLNEGWAHTEASQILNPETPVTVVSVERQGA